MTFIDLEFISDSQHTALMPVDQDELDMFQKEFELSKHNGYEAPIWLKEFLFFGFRCDPGNKIPTSLCVEFLRRLNLHIVALKNKEINEIEAKNSP